VDDDVLRKNIGANARKARDALGLTQAEVAAQADLSAQVYGRIERGHLMPSVGALVRIARALCTDPNSLLGLNQGGTLEAAGSPEVQRAVLLMREWPESKVRAGCELLRVLHGVATRDE
jgi:transcriptional regulator with XRE-family HTH domain